MRLCFLVLAASCFVAFTDTYADDLETRFLIPGELIFQAQFDDGDKPPAKPTWFLRKSDWKIHDGALRGVNAGGNGPFIRLQSKENGGPLPEDYILKFSFKIEENPGEKRSNKHHETLSSGHRFSFGHYAAKYQWRPEGRMDLNIGHGDALEDDSFQIEKFKWYHVTAEIRGDEILVWFQDGPAYFMQHDHFRSKPAGWEFFTHVSEAGLLDNLRVWSLADGQRDNWPQTKSEITTAKRSFLSPEHPDFVTVKRKTK